MAQNEELFVDVLVLLTHCERFSLASTCDKAEALGLNSHSGALNMLFDIPDGRN